MILTDDNFTSIDEETNMDVRDPNDTSKLRLGSRTIINQESIHLEFDRDNKIEITGFDRNWWLLLDAIKFILLLIELLCSTIMKCCGWNEDLNSLTIWKLNNT